MLAGLALVGGTFIAALSSDKVETAAVQLAAAELSRALGTNAQVGSVSYQFPARLTIKDIYLEDRQGDTLAYVGEAYAQFSPLALRHGEIKFSHVRLNDVLADVHQIEIPSAEGASTKEWNYQFLVDAFRTDEKKESNPMRSIVAVKDVQLDNIRLRYEDYEAFVSHADMDLHRLSAETLDAEITELSAVVDKKPSGGDLQSPLVIKDLDAHVILTDSLLNVPIMHAQLPQSELELSEISLRLPFEAASLEAPLRIDAELVPAEISLFVPALKTMGAKVTLIGPATLMPPAPEALGADDVSARLDDVLPDLDVVYMLRIQQERLEGAPFPSLREYSMLFGLNEQRDKIMRPDAIICHPGPINRGVELDSFMADHPTRSVILDQVYAGVLVRMAALYLLLGGGEDSFS